ncbi:AraC-type DNA-binding protein [Paenibacillus sp. UNCCL117]|uniref:AraC family transcriptional regulator n=1 Tax=unclassified Paenibacillus TaxID=185978 RepID=UPI00087ED6E1|nr:MULTISPECIES: AraC family transcriptional regulator [unclassified Paenibacillus]SDE11552.1 AraC-type DNA-binding protein [Paenibacillus sp. cl123]SFW60007.1 AraC-type DNA-binding protein [Paenibacillus sp. UNCCL117]
MNEEIVSALLGMAELKLLKFDVHRLHAMNYRNRTFQEYYMMTYVRKGTAKLRVQDRIYPIRPGTVIFIPIGLEHDQYMDTDEETEFLWWHFTYKIHGVIDVLPFFHIPYIYPLKNYKKFEAVFDEFMLSTTRGGYIPNVILQKAKSLELLYVLLDNAFGNEGAIGAGQPPSSFLSVLLKIVSQPEATFSLQELAADLHMSPTYVSNHFKELFGKPPILLHREIKIAKAKSLLEMQEMNIMEISGYLGFNDVQTFARQFKKYTGISPGQYKGLFKRPPV